MPRGQDLNKMGIALNANVGVFVSGQALDLNDDSKTEQLITFLDDICRLRCVRTGVCHSSSETVRGCGRALYVITFPSFFFSLYYFRFRGSCSTVLLAPRVFAQTVQKS